MGMFMPLLKNGRQMIWEASMHR